MSIRKLWNKLVKDKVTKFRLDWLLEFRKKQAEQAKQTGQVEDVEKSEKMGKTRIFLIFLSFLFAIVGVGQFFWCATFSLIFPYCYLIYFLASVVFLTISILMGKGGWRNSLFAIFCFFLQLFLWLVFMLILYPRAKTTDVSKYDNIICSWQDDWIAHFPRTIPAEAKNVRFYYSPVLWSQGSFIFQLRYSCDSLLIDQLYSFYSMIKTKSFIGGNSNARWGEPGGLPTINFYTTVSGYRRFPKDYEMLLLSKIDKSNYWNHGGTRGVAISRKRGVIVYWAESW